jgi:hypothetical protein
LDLNLPTEVIDKEIDALEAEKASYGKYNKGKDDRRKEELSPEEIAVLEAKAPTMMTLFKDGTGVF